MAGKTAREREMREVVAKQQASGLTQRAFSASIGMNVGTFGWWKREIARRDRRRVDHGEAAPGAVPSPTFLPVELIDCAGPPITSAASGAATAKTAVTGSTSAARSLSVQIADLHICVPHDFDAAHLQRLVTAVRAC
jgi:hypothetical protein